jgi:hypothetical protein
MDHSDVEVSEKSSAATERITSPSTIEKGTVNVRQVDGALYFLKNDDTVDQRTGGAVTIDEKKLVRKIDFMIIPLMWSAYFLQYLGEFVIV